MLFRAVVFVALCFARAEIVYKRDCDGVGSAMCQVTSVDVESCRNAPRFCRVGSGKRYPITVGFVPQFTADKVMLSTSLDLQNSRDYTVVATTKRVCEDHLLVCPLEPHIRQSLQFDFIVNDRLNGSIPARVQFWNADNPSDICCFTFKIKSSWHPNQL